MKFDLEKRLGTVERSVAVLERDGEPVRAVTVTRVYDTTIDDLWDAATNSERLPRWFAPVSGNLEPGGRYQIKDNAQGKIEQCDPPSHLALTWEYGGVVSWVEAHIEEEPAARSRLTLTHIVPVDDHWEKYGPGATGVGWDLALVGLAHHLSDVGEEPFDEEVFSASPGGKAFVIRSSDAWGQADIAAGENPDQARAAAEETAAFFTGDAAEDT